MTARDCKCGHRTHDTWGCLTPECGCDTPWDKVLVTAAERAERDRLLARIEAYVDLLTEQGDEHVAGCAGQADCAACVAADLRALVAEERAW